MSKPPLEIAVRRLRPDEEEPDRLPLRWSTITRLLAFTSPHRLQRNTLLVLCVFRAMALPGLAWLVGAIIKGPVQAGDDLILKHMKRRHTRRHVVGLAARLRALRPGLAFGADIIAGFPTETEEMFQASLRLVDEAGLTHLHVFQFSARPGTPAARMPQVPGDVARERAARLRARGAAAMGEFLAARVGTRALVLLEKPGFGHSEHYLPVQVAGKGMAGEIVAVRVTGVQGTTALDGEREGDSPSWTRGAA